MTDEPLSLGNVTHKAGHNFRWTLVAFAAAGLLMAGLVVWQLKELSPSLYCAIAEHADNAGCTSLLLKLLDNKDHALIGSLTILGITVLSIVVVALGVSIKATGPGGTGVDLGAPTPPTVIEQGEKQIVIPSPPPAE